MQPRRIGLVIGQLTAGGAEGQLLLVARALVAAGYEPVVYCSSAATEPIGSELAACGVPVRVFGGPQRARPRKLAASIVRDEISLVHSWLYIGNTYAWLARFGVRRVPLVTSARNCKRQGLLHGWANRFAFRSSRRIVANSEEVRAYIERVYGAPADRIAVLYNGVDVDRFCPGSGGGAEKCIVGIGRLVPQKAPDHFVRAAARIAGRHRDAHFVFLGEGPMRSGLQEQIRAHGLENRFELPGVTRDVPAVLRRAKLFWLTSAWEGLPNAVLEAMACGVPVIVTDVGGTRELLSSGEEGFLFRYGDLDSLQHYSDALLADDTRWREMSRRARDRALRFSTNEMTTAMIALYREVLEEASPAASSTAGRE